MNISESFISSLQSRQRVKDKLHTGCTKVEKAKGQAEPAKANRELKRSVKVGKKNHTDSLTISSQ